MDPYSLAAVGLAGNIVQFIDFGAKLPSKANQIRKEGSTTENVHLEIVTKDLSLYTDSSRVEWESWKMEELSSGAQERLGEESSDRAPGPAKPLQLADGSQLLASIRTRADVAFLEQAGQLADANVGIQAALGQLREIERTSQQNTEALTLNDEMILTVVETSAASNNTEHFETRAVVAHAALNMGMHVASAVEVASEENRQQHEATRVEMERVRLEAEKQVQELREEIRLLKIEIEQSVQKVIASVGKVSAREQQRLKRWSNAKFSLWVAKEIMLKSLLEVLNLFKS
ncbi:hypothetical protein B0O99DRAFT_689061 [Bisporella sp. PMI_857]|nr:hypothetical protein B0O99DRAFT_689061 [Bisporella sp. PMI_857]